MLFCLCYSVIAKNKENKMTEKQTRHEILLMVMNLKKQGQLNQCFKDVIKELWHTSNTEYIYELHSLLEDALEINQAV